MARWDDTEWYRSSRWSDGVAAEFERRLRQARAYNRAQYVRIQGTHLLQQDDAGTRAVGRALMRRVIDEYGPTDPDAWFAAHQLAESLRVDDSAAVAESALRDALAMAVPTGRETPPTTALSLAEMLCERGDEDALEEATVLLDSVHEGIVEMALFRDLVLRYLVVRAHVAHRHPHAAAHQHAGGGGVHRGPRPLRSASAVCPRGPAGPTHRRARAGLPSRAYEGYGAKKVDRPDGTGSAPSCGRTNMESTMTTASRSFARPLRRLAAAATAVLVLAAGGVATSSAASAAPPACAGRGVPTSKISVQLWTFAEYIGFDTDAATVARTEEVLARLSEMGYRNVEPFTLSGLTAEQYRALLDEYGLKASARHVDVGTPEDPADIDQILADNRTLGIKYFGSGSTPIFPLTYSTEAEWIAYAEYLDELGAQARRQGQTLMVHNHDVEFQVVFGDRTVFDILMAHTERKNVVFQLDLYWATAGDDEENPIDVIERYGNRIKLFHVKDMAEGTFPGRIEIVGQGIIDFPSIFDAAGGSTKYYVVEHDPRFGDPTFDPFEAADEGFDYLTCMRF